MDKVKKMLKGMPKKEVINPKVQKSTVLTGWICPVCGKGNSPFSSSCPCVSSFPKPYPKPYPMPEPYTPFPTPNTPAPNYPEWPEYRPFWYHGPTC